MKGAVEYLHRSGGGVLTRLATASRAVRLCCLIHYSSLVFLFLTPPVRVADKEIASVRSAKIENPYFRIMEIISI
jgi:hypothetical protein